MRVLLNNREEEIGKETVTVSELLVMKKFSFKMRIIKINGVFIPKENYNSAVIQQGDNVQILYLMSGG